MSDLEVQTREVDDVVLLYPRGFINAHTVRVFEGEIQKALDRRRYKIVLSCAGLQYIASAGLGAIMGAIDRRDLHPAPLEDQSRRLRINARVIMGGVEVKVREP